MTRTNIFIKKDKESEEDKVGKGRREKGERWKNEEGSESLLLEWRIWYLLYVRYYILEEVKWGSKRSKRVQKIQP